MLAAVVVLVILALAAAKPYQTPMMGKETGKRTLILVDDMVCVPKQFLLPNLCISALCFPHYYSPCVINQCHTNIFFLYRYRRLLSKLIVSFWRT